jgi:phosphate transport system substrate-binding protein
MKTIPLVAALCAQMFFMSCENYDRSAESSTSGKLRMGVDESYSLMMESQQKVFEQLYKYSDIQSSFKPEGEVFEDLMNDSIQLAIVSRPLTEEEMAFFHAKKRLPESVKIATDALALVVNLSNNDSVFTVQQVEQMMDGRLSTWKSLNPTSTLGDIQIVFDNNRSCNERYVRENILKGKPLSKSCFAADGNLAVVDYVQQNPGAIGLISVSWITDREDSTTQDILKKVKVVGLVDPSNAKKPTMARKPYQAYIYDGTYPYRREVYAVRTGLRGSVGTGFVSHLAGEKGQLIIHKMGMVAASAPTRIIKITE